MNWMYVYIANSKRYKGIFYDVLCRKVIVPVKVK